MSKEMALRDHLDFFLSFTTGDEERFHANASASGLPTDVKILRNFSELRKVGFQPSLNEEDKVCLKHLKKGAYNISVPDLFIDKVCVLISSIFLTFPSVMSRFHDLTSKEAPDFLLKEAQTLKVFKELGATGFWNALNYMPDLADLHAKALLSLKQRGLLRFQLAKLACLAAVGFLTFHESAHVVGGHIQYRKAWLCRNLSDSKSELYRHQIVLEHAADLACQYLFKTMMLCHKDVFEGMVSIEEGHGADDNCAFYCCGLAAGIGISSILFLTDILQVAAPTDCHPPGIERLTLIFGSELLGCSGIRKNDNTPPLFMFYTHGFFDGSRQLLGHWDKIGLARTKSKYFDDLIKSEIVCAICNPSGKYVFETLKKLRDDAEVISNRIRTWALAHGGNIMMDENLQVFDNTLRNLEKKKEEKLQSILKQ